MANTYCSTGLADLIHQHNEECRDPFPLRKLKSTDEKILLQYSGERGSICHVFFTIGIDYKKNPIDLESFFEIFGGQKEIVFNYLHKDSQQDIYFAFKNGYCSSSNGRPILLANFLQRFNLDSQMEETPVRRFFYNLGAIDSPHTGRVLPIQQPVYFSSQDLKKACDIGYLSNQDTTVISKSDKVEGKIHYSKDKKAAYIHLKSPKGQDFDLTEKGLQQVFSIECTDVEWKEA